MDLLAELETMAVNVTEEEEMISDADVQRWQNLFGLTRLESSKAIETYHGDYSRARIADEHWDAVKSEQEAKGHNRESYEYSLTQTRKGTKLFSTPVERGSFIVQLAGPLDTAERSQEAAALSQVPPLATGSGEDGEAHICEIDGAAKISTPRLASKAPRRLPSDHPPALEGQEGPLLAYSSTNAGNGSHPPTTPTRPRLFRANAPAGPISRVVFLLRHVG